jgi:polyadenylate-binding protein
VLSPFPPSDPPTPIPPPLALPRLIKHLPVGTTDAQLFDLFRPFGPIAAVRNPASFGPDTGVIEYWNEDDAKRAEEAMHCANFNGNNIAVQVYQPRRGGHVDFNASAAPFVPSAGLPTYTPSSPGRAPFQSPVSKCAKDMNRKH